MITNNLQILEKALPIGSLEAYSYWVNQIPMLSQEEEHDLATKFRQDGDLAAARQLVLAHLRFVVHIVRNYANYGLQKADLIQEGNIGLMKAVKRFDPNLGVRLVSFAVHWIKAEIHEFVLRNWRIVRMATTKAQRKLFFNLRKMANKLGRLGWFSDSEIELVAKELKVRPKDVANMEMRLNSPDVAFDAFADTNDENNSYNVPANYLEDPSSDIAASLEQTESKDQQEHCLTEALKTLDERSRAIVGKRWLAKQKATLHELADQYHVSAERIRQIEENALRKLKEKIKASTAA